MEDYNSMKTLEEKLAQAVASCKAATTLVEDVKKQIEESRELKPYDWCDNHSDHKYWNTNTQFHFIQRGDVEKFDHKLKILSCINNLKKTLGCNWEFTSGSTNYHVTFTKGRWGINHLSTVDDCLIYFEKAKDVSRVAKYLSKHYPNGWSLTEGA